MSTARDSLAADRDAEQAWEDAESARDLTLPATEYFLRAIAAELRAARVYANYLEGRDLSRTSQKRKTAKMEPDA